VPEGSRAWQDGEREFTQEGIYVLGELPDSYREADGEVAYAGDDGARWYVAGHWSGASVEPYHRFGSWFVLHPDTQDVTAEYPALPLTIREAL
jgi:hypothetical protein